MVIFKATEVVNFAHGSLVLIGGFVVYELKDTLGSGRGRRDRHRGGRAGRPAHRAAAAGSRAGSADHNSLALLTIGIDVIITEEIVRRRRRRRSRSSATRTTRSRSSSAGLTVFRTQAVALVVGAVLITLFFLAFRYSNWGVAMRAQAENREAAALMGIRSARVTATAWLVAGALAGVAVLFMATQDFSGAGLGRGTHAIALIAFPAAILGGLDSTAGAIVGGVVVGLTEALSAQYISFEFSKSAVFLVMLLVLVRASVRAVRHQGAQPCLRRSPRPADARGARHPGRGGAELAARSWRTVLLLAAWCCCRCSIGDQAGYLKLAQYVLIGVVGGIGLTLLVGQAGQLSLAHPFFLLVGGGQLRGAGRRDRQGERDLVGLGCRRCSRCSARW